MVRRTGNHGIRFPGSDPKLASESTTAERDETLRDRKSRRRDRQPDAKPRSFPPRPSDGLPLVGCLPAFAGDQLVYSAAVTREYGDVADMNLAG